MKRPTAYMGDQPYIFVSYSHRETERVWPLIQKLQDDGFRVWYDDGINPGTEWDANIAVHIRKCAFFLAFISANYLASENCKDELSFVRELNKNRVLVYLEEVILPDELQMRLGRLQAIYWNQLGAEKAYDKLLLSPGLDICREPVSAPLPSASPTGAPASHAATAGKPVSPAAPAGTAVAAKATAGTPASSAAPAQSSLSSAAPAGTNVSTAAPAGTPASSAAPAGTTDRSKEAKTISGESHKGAVPPMEKGPAQKEPAQKGSVQKEPAKKIQLIAAGIGVVVVLILAVVLVTKPSESQKTTESTAIAEENISPQDSSQDNETENTDSDENTVANDQSNEEDTGADLTGVLSVYKNGVFTSKTGSALAGVLMVDNTYSYTSSTFRKQQELDYNGETYIVARLPFITISSYYDENSIILGFYDEFGGEFYFYGTYAIEAGKLTISPGGSAGTFEKDCAPLTQELIYDYHYTTGGAAITYEEDSVRLSGYSEDAGTLVLKGSLSEGNEPYEYIKSLDLVYDIETEDLKKCVLILEGEGVTATANVDSCNYFSSKNISLRWSSIQYKLNGRFVTKDVNGYADIFFINQNPAGFTITYDSGNKAVYYQDVQ